MGHRLQLDSDDDDDMNEYSRERDRSTMKVGYDNSNFVEQAPHRYLLMSLLKFDQ